MSGTGGPRGFWCLEEMFTHFQIRLAMHCQYFLLKNKKGMALNLSDDLMYSD